eukprot:scaffold42367_cov61-Phaeocystis_antarctica.AAC.6
MRDEARAGRREGGGASSVQGRTRLHNYGGSMRTENIQLMSVTLDVSRVSGWLNALAPCRDSKGGHTIRGDMRAGAW